MRELDKGLDISLTGAGAEKAISVFHSNHYVKEYIPKEKKITPLGPH